MTKSTKQGTLWNPGVKPRLLSCFREAPSVTTNSSHGRRARALARDLLHVMVTTAGLACNSESGLPLSDGSEGSVHVDGSSHTPGQHGALPPPGPHPWTHDPPASSLLSNLSENLLQVFSAFVCLSLKTSSRVLTFPEQRCALVCKDGAISAPVWGQGGAGMSTASILARKEPENPQVHDFPESTIRAVRLQRQSQSWRELGTGGGRGLSVC